MSQEYPRVYIQVNYRQCTYGAMVEGSEVSLVSEGPRMSIFLFSTNTNVFCSDAGTRRYIYFSHNKAINSLPNNTHCVLLNTWGCTCIFLSREKI